MRGLGALSQVSNCSCTINLQVRSVFNFSLGTSLVVQLLALHTSTAGGMG